MTLNYLRLLYAERGRLALKVVQLTLETFGVLWLLVQLCRFFKFPLADALPNYWGWFCLVGVGAGLIRAAPKSCHAFMLAGRDVIVEIRVADCLDVTGALVVPTNTSFDTDLDGVISKGGGVQGQVQRRYFEGKVSELDQLLSDELRRQQLVGVAAPPGKPGKQTIYPIGSTAIVRHKERLLYFMAMSTVSADGRVSASLNDVVVSLKALWVFVKNKGDRSPLVIPVVGTGHARTSEPRARMVRRIVASFLQSCRDSAYVPKFTVCLHPDDVGEFAVPFEEVCAFAGHLCGSFDVLP